MHRLESIEPAAPWPIRPRPESLHVAPRGRFRPPARFTGKLYG